MGTLFAAVVITFTVAGSVTLGITLAYSSVLLLLYTFARSARQPQPMVLAHSQSPAGGD